MRGKCNGAQGFRKRGKGNGKMRRHNVGEPDMPDIQMRIMTRQDWPQVADLIQVSTNYWYQRSGKPPIFTCRPQDMELFCKVYEDLDPGCCVVAESTATGR